MGQKGILSTGIVSIEHGTIRHSHTLTSPNLTLATANQLTDFVFSIDPNQLCSKDYRHLGTLVGRRGASRLLSLTTVTDEDPRVNPTYNSCAL